MMGICDASIPKSFISRSTSSFRYWIEQYSIIILGAVFISDPSVLYNQAGPLSECVAAVRVQQPELDLACRKIE